MKWEEVKTYSWMSECEQHKLVTAMEWNADAKGIVLIGLNPSIQDGIKSRTVKKIIKILDNNGYGSFCLGNLYTERCTKSQKLRRTNHEDADKALQKMFALDTDILWCYGNHQDVSERISEVAEMAPVTREWLCFGTNKNGTPKHPLLLKNKTKLEKYEL